MLFNQYVCPVCGEWFTNRKNYGGHLRQHNLLMCKICMKSNRFLNIDTQIYDQKAYNAHLKQHPRCTCCSYQGFDAKALADHVLDDHFRCDICAKHDKIRWFRDLNAIRDHYLQYHYPCTEPNCFETGLIVFDSMLELQLHQIQVHGKKLPVSFGKRPDIVDDDFEREQRERREHDERDRALYARLRDRSRDALGYQSAFDRLMNIIKQLDREKISPKEFVDRYNNVTGKSSELLFCDTVAMIKDPSLRSQVVRIFEGYRTGKVTREAVMAVEFPELSVANQTGDDTESGPEDEPEEEKPAPEPERAPKPSRKPKNRRPQKWNRVKV